MKKRCLILAFALMFLGLNLGLSTNAVAEKRYGIEWEPLYERIDAQEYKLPEGWQEAVKGIKEIKVFNFSAVMPWDIGTQKTADLFTKLTGIRVKWIIPPTPIMVPKQMSLLMAKSPEADVLTFLEYQIEPFKKAGWLEPLDFLYNDKLWKNYPQAFREAASYKGQVYGVPNIMKVFVLNWRPDMYKAAGIEAPPKTWDELIDIGKKLTIDKNGDGVPEQYGLIYPSDETYVMYMVKTFLYNIGGDFIDANGKINVNTPKMKTAVQFLVDLRNKHKIVPPLVTQLEYIKLVDQFSRGTTANTIFGFELMTQPAVFSVSKELAQASIPQGPGGQLGGTQAQFEIVAMNPYSKKKAAAALYLDVRHSRQSARFELLDERNNAWYLPVFDEPEVAKEIPNVDVLKLATQNAKSATFEFNSEVMQICAKEVMNAQLGEKSVDAALKDAQSKIESMLAY